MLSLLCAGLLLLAGGGGNYVGSVPIQYMMIITIKIRCPVANYVLYQISFARDAEALATNMSLTQ